MIRLGIKITRFKFICLIVIGVIIWFVFGYNSTNRSSANRVFILKYLNEKATKTSYLDVEFISKIFDTNRNKKEKNSKCRMETCFDYSKCSLEGFKIFIYTQPNLIVSSNYKKIIDILSDSKYITTNPQKACLFISSIDTLDRDKLSTNYVKNLKKIMPNLEHWNRTGSNHVIFNLYSGSWPSYDENLKFDPMHAILVKASFSIRKYRKNFDVSLPLFHADLPFNESFSLPQVQNILLLKKKYLLTFKGKRYLSGFGSETRNALYHLNNGRDIILLTTCKHGYNWEEFKDSRCDIDNMQYEKYDYIDLLYNSTFCLIPRGRRLATYRFLEALKAGCIPIVLSNTWILPFSEIIDWKKCALIADERLLVQIPTVLRKMPPDKIVEMKRYALLYYSKYFSSVEKIIMTSLHIIRERIFKTL